MKVKDVIVGSLLSVFSILRQVCIVAKSACSFLCRSGQPDVSVQCTQDGFL